MIPGESTQIVGEPVIEDDAVVVRVIVRDEGREDTGRVFVCRFTSFDSLSVRAFPEGQAPITTGKQRAAATKAAESYAAENLELFEALFEELARRKR